MNDVEVRHPQYENSEYQWRQLRDSASGTTAIKRSGSLYLPIPSAMFQAASTPAGISQDHGQTNLQNAQHKDLAANAPWAHSIPAYSAYLQRARFPDIVASCMRGFIGIVSKKDPEVKLPNSIAYLEEKATKDGLSLNALFKKAVWEVLLMGRYSLLVDPDEDGQIVFISYNAESFINWKTTVVGTDIVPTLAVFEEFTPAADATEFSHADETAHRVLRINEKGHYESELVMSDNSKTTNEPSIKGQTMPVVPLVTMNAMQLGAAVGSSPMLGISDIAISIYQKEADMSQSEFITCNPMLVVTGADADDVPNAVGSSVAWILSNPEAKAFYVEPESTSLQHMKGRIEDLHKEAANQGASVLGGDKKAAESTETTRMKQEASGATLKSVVSTVQQGFVAALKIAAAWTNGDASGVEFEPNMEFSELTLTAQEQTALLNAWMNKGISHETYLQNMKDAGIIPEDRDIQAEMGAIETASPDLNV